MSMSCLFQPTSANARSKKIHHHLGQPETLDDWWRTQNAKGTELTFKSGDEMILRTARVILNRAIRRAKRKILDFFRDPANTRDMWRGIQTITTITILTKLRCEGLWGVNSRKAPGPDNIPRWVIRKCADQLACVLTDIFNTLLDQAKVTSCFKTSTIIPVPLLAKDEQSLPAPAHPHYILQEHHREHPDQLLLHVVWRLQSLWLEEYEESGGDNEEDHWDFSPPPFMTLPPSTACAELGILSETPPILTLDCFPCWVLERGPAAFGARPQGSIKWSPMSSDCWTLSDNCHLFWIPCFIKIFVCCCT